jgi:hypothetical protein
MGNKIDYHELEALARRGRWLAISTVAGSGAGHVGYQLSGRVSLAGANKIQAGSLCYFTPSHGCRGFAEIAPGCPREIARHSGKQCSIGFQPVLFAPSSDPFQVSPFLRIVYKDQHCAHVPFTVEPTTRSSMPCFWNSLKTFEEIPESVIVKWISEKSAKLTRQFRSNLDESVKI